MIFFLKRSISYLNIFLNWKKYFNKDSSSTNPAINSFSEPKYSDTDYGSVAFYLNGPVIKTGGQFISAPHNSNGYDINSGIKSLKAKTSSCFVGKLGVDAYATGRIVYFN